jgi:hypothetical protein
MMPSGFFRVQSYRNCVFGSVDCAVVLKLLADRVPLIALLSPDQAEAARKKFHDKTLSAEQSLKD